MENQLSEITEPITADIINSQGTSLDDINSNLSILPDEFTLINAEEQQLSVNKYSLELLTTLKPNDIKGLDKLKSIQTILNNTNAEIKFAIKIDNEYKTNSNSLTIPSKPYNELSEDELTQWNESKQTILDDGFTIEQLQDIDTLSQTIEGLDKLKGFSLAFVIKHNDFDSSLVLNAININYDKLGLIKELDDNEFELSNDGQQTIIIPKSDNFRLIANIIK